MLHQMLLELLQYLSFISATHLLILSTTRSTLQSIFLEVESTWPAVVGSGEVVRGSMWCSSSARRGRKALRWKPEGMWEMLRE